MFPGGDRAGAAAAYPRSRGQGVASTVLAGLAPLPCFEERTAAGGDAVGGGSEDGTYSTSGCEDGGHSKTMSAEHVSGGASGLLGGQVDNGCVVGEGSARGGLRSVVESLIGLELDSVFRTVVSFL